MVAVLEVAVLELADLELAILEFKAEAEALIHHHGIPFCTAF